MPVLVAKLLEKIKDPIILREYCSEDLASIYLSYPTSKFTKLLTNLDSTFLSEITEETSRELAATILDEFSDSKSIEETTDLIIRGNFAAKDIISSLLAHYYEKDSRKTLDSILNIMLNKHNPYNYLDKNLQRRTFINDYFNEIRARLSFDDLNYLALELSETKNYPQMLDFLAHIDTPNNSYLIEKLVGKVSESMILYTVSLKFIPDALNKILSQGEFNNIGIPTLDAIFLTEDEYSNEKLNAILDNLYLIDPNIKFSRVTTIKLLKQGVMKFSKLLETYELTEEERTSILNSLLNINSLMLPIYGVI